MPAYSDRYEAALTLAAQAHRTQYRKGGEVPYIVHVVHVAAILERHGLAQDVVLAGLLHDVVEDSGIPLARIEVEFGPQVAEMVGALTERKTEGGVQRPWEIRKEEALAQLERASLDAVAVKAADTLHTSRSLAAELGQHGPSYWANFSRGPGPSLGYYQRVAELVRRRMGDHPLSQELQQAVLDLEAAIAQTAHG
jgi:(p)ppGpp synthase/HD superfamily hydrolase